MGGGGLPFEKPRGGNRGGHDQVRGQPAIVSFHQVEHVTEFLVSPHHRPRAVQLGQSAQHGEQGPRALSWSLGKSLHGALAKQP